MREQGGGWMCGAQGAAGTMMPGETQLPPAGTAAAAVPCKNCGVLQQNINEYVAALVALKQKMINGDRLLTEYQQKCTELQFAEREISALRCQVEQMLQKIQPLEKGQKELSSLKAELEEKKSSLKIYQESQLECVRIKEEIVKSDAVRKKLEAKVKKLEEAATKHTQDFKQLKIEKKKLEKELKKAQGKLDGVLKEKCRKVKHAETQSSNEDLTADIDKEKVKFLLEELWMCIDSAKEKRVKQENDPILASAQDKAWPGKRRLFITKETVQTHQKIAKCGGKTVPWQSSIESAGRQNSVTALQFQVNTEPTGGDCLENWTTEDYLQGCEDKATDVIVQTDGTHSSSAFSDQEQKGQGGNVMDILNWVRPLPALLSPVQLSPVATQDILFGELTGSSDEEVDCSASAVECILQEDQAQPQNCCNVFKLNEECNRWNKPHGHSLDAETLYNSSRTEKIVPIDPEMLIKEEGNAKQCEVATSITTTESNRDCLEENSENMETLKRDLMETTACELEAKEERKGDIKEMHNEETVSSIHSMLHRFNLQNQIERCSEVEQTEENVILVRAGGYEGTHEKYGELMKAEHEREIPKAVSIPQNVTHLHPEQYLVLQRKDSEEKSGVLIESEVVENECKDSVKITNMAINVEENVKQVITGEEATATIQMQGLCAKSNNKRELSVNVLYNSCSFKSFCEAKCPEDLIIQHDGEGIVMETDVCTEFTETSVCSQCSEIRHDSEKILKEQCTHTLKYEIVRKHELETAKVSQCYLPVSAVEGIEHSLCMDDTNKKVCVAGSASLAFPEDDGQLKIQDVIRPKSVELTMKLNKESVLEIAESSELLHSAENGKLLYEKEGEDLKGKNHQEENYSHFFQGKSNLESIPPEPKVACITDAESSVAKCESSVLDCTERNGEIKQPENLCSTLECGLSKTQNSRVIESQETEFKVNQEDFVGESSKLLEVDTVQSVLVESSLNSQTQFAKPQNQLLVTENAKCDKTKAELNKQSNKLMIEACPNSFKGEKNVVKKNDSEIIHQPTSEMDFNSGFALYSQMDLKTDCTHSEETDSPVQVRNGLESTVPSDLNFSLQKVVRVVETNFTENSDFPPTWEKKGDKNCIMSSAFNCSLEGLKKGAEIMSTEKVNVCKELESCSEKCIHKNEGEVPGEKELPVGEEPEASVKLQILHADSCKKNTLTFQNFICQESECKTSTWEARTDSSRTCSLTAGGESKGLNRFEASEENSIKGSAFDIAEQSNESKEKDYPLQKGRCVKCSECVPMLRKELRASTRIVVDALEAGAIVDAGDQLCELHSTAHSGNTETGSHLKPDAVMDMDIHCEIGSSPDVASEMSDVVEEGYPKDFSSLKRGCTLASENTDGASEFRVDNSITGWMNDSREDLSKTGTSKGSPVMLSASKSRLPLRQVLTTFSEAYRIAVKHSKLNTRMLALSNFIEENYSEKFESNVKQSLPHNVDMDISIFEEYNRNQNCSACNSGENNTNVMLDGFQPSCCFSGTTWRDFLDSGRKNFIVKYFANPALSDVDCNSQTVSQAPKPQKMIFENSCMLESESCVDVALKKTNKSNCKGQEQSEVLSVSAKTAVQVMHGRLSKKLFQGKRKTNALEVKVTEPVLANADTSMPTKCLSETINKIRQEMGPPLPPLLLPLIATPPRAVCSMAPVISSADRSSLLSPLDELISPLRESPVPSLMSPLTDTPTVKSALLFSSPSPSEMAVGKRILSSPLQFCTSIPKHALPVPGRFPLCAADSAAAGAPQENSVKILDTMYPELSARARTLNILKGNIQLNLCALSDSQSSPGPVAQISGFKTIASTSTAFVKTGSNLKSDGSKDQDKNVKNQKLISSSSSRLEKRTLLPVPMPKSAKRLRLDSEPPKLEPSGIAAVRNGQNLISEIEENFDDKSYGINDSAQGSSLETSLPLKKIRSDPDCQKAYLALKKIAESCFDLLPVIQSHLGDISKIPIIRDEEKEVVNEFGIKNKHLAESLLHVILNTLKAQKIASSYNFSQALCRVYTGICRQLGDLERARLFCYSLLKEDFPDSDKLILFITNIWPDIFFFQGAINKAMQLIIRQNANDSVLACLNAYLSWEQGSSLDAGIMVSNLLLEMQSCPKVDFQLNEQYGEDLSEDAWQYIFAIDLLCSHLKWDWTHDNVISKVLWPSMDKWIKTRKEHESAQSIPDSIIALTLRLIGRLGQIGLKEGYLSAVKNISSVIGMFVQHAKEEDVPWGVQLAAIYSLCDLGPSNPVGIVGAIHAWRAAVLNSVPFAVTSGLAKVNSLCKMELH